MAVLFALIVALLDDDNDNRGKVADRNSIQDLLGDVWDKELEPMLKQKPQLKPMTLFEYLLRHLSWQMSKGTENDSTTSLNLESLKRRLNYEKLRQ